MPLEMFAVQNVEMFAVQSLPMKLPWLETFMPCRTLLSCARPCLPVPWHSVSVTFCLVTSVCHALPWRSVPVPSFSVPFHALTDPVLSCPPCPDEADEASDDASVQPLPSPTSGLCPAQPLASVKHSLWPLPSAASVQPSLWPLSSAAPGLCPAQPLFYAPALPLFLGPAGPSFCFSPQFSLYFLTHPSLSFLPQLDPAQIPAAHVHLHKVSSNTFIKYLQTRLHLQKPYPYHALPCPCLDSHLIWAANQKSLANNDIIKYFLVAKSLQKYGQDPIIKPASGRGNPISWFKRQLKNYKRKWYN